MKTILVVFGTRPEAIKLAPVVLELKKHKSITTKVCVTAQHREMLDQVLNIFNLVPDVDLNIMKSNQSLFDITGSVLNQMQQVLQDIKPDIVVVQGDTTTTFATTLAAFYLKIPVAHVEAGLRTHNKYSPFPEEINRKLTGHIADIHFPPTDVSKENLLREGIHENAIHVTGNTVVDALLWVSHKLQKNEPHFEELDNIDFSKKIILVTGHRRENFGPDFVNICNALKEISEKYKDIEIVYPVHLNPNVRRPVYEILGGAPNIKLLEPLDYEPFVWLMTKSFFIISDSGGIQEEAPSLGKPVLVTRKNTERPEAVDAGAVKLVGTNREDIITRAVELIENDQIYRNMAAVKNPYGDGKASQRIVEILKSWSQRGN